jgi:uncharacterized protein YndB with AHSA1/START domain
MPGADDHTARASIEIAASPQAVYDLVTDVTRMGEWSPEATGARGASAALRAGDRFWGLNRRGAARWFTRCTVRQAEPGRRFVFDVDFPPAPVSRWTYEFEPTADGCRVTETWEDRRFGPLGPAVRAVGNVLIPGPRAAHNQRNIETTLARLKAAAES